MRSCLGNICSAKKHIVTFIPYSLLSSQHICVRICFVTPSRKTGTLLSMRVSALRTLCGPAPLLPLVIRKLPTHCLTSVHSSIQTRRHACVLPPGQLTVIIYSKCASLTSACNLPLSSVTPGDISKFCFLPGDQFRVTYVNLRRSRPSFIPLQAQLWGL